VHRIVVLFVGIEIREYTASILATVVVVRRPTSTGGGYITSSSSN